MILNIVSKLNRNVSYRPGSCLLPQNIYGAEINVNCKYTVATNDNEKFKRNSGKKVNDKKQILTNLKPFVRKNYANYFGPLKDRLDREMPQDEGDIAEEEYFKNIPLRSDQLPLKKYAEMIKQHIKNKCLKDAIDVLEVRMKNDRVKPDYYIYELLTMECGRLGYTKKAFQLYNRCKQRDLRVSSPTYAGLFNACANATYRKEGLQQATHLRKIMIQKSVPTNEIIMNTMIKAFGRCGDITTAFELVDEMKENKLPVKLDTMNHLLQACIDDKELGFRHALLVWHKIYQRKMTPDVFSYNLMLRCIRECGVGDMNSMRSVLTMIFSASHKQLKMKLTKENKGNVLLMIEDKPTESINQNERSTSIEIAAAHDAVNDKVLEKSCDQMPNLLAKLPHLGSLVELNEIKTAEDRLLILGGLSGFIKEMELAKVRPNVKTFSQIMYAIPSTREAEHELIEKMREVRVRADTDFFNLLMKRRILREDFDGAKIVLEMLNKVELDPDIVTYGIMALACRTREQAQAFLNQLKEKNVKPNIQILGSLLKNVKYVQDDEFANDILKCAMVHDLKPNEDFIRKATTYKCIRYDWLLKNTDENDEQRKRYSKFYKTYKQWRKQMGIFQLPLNEVKKIVNEHPWKQFKENEREGAEELKNSKIRHLWKRQHVLKKLTPKRLHGLHDAPNEDKIEDSNNKSNNKIVDSNASMEKK